MKLNRVRASAWQEGHVHVDRDINIKEGGIKGTLQVETVVRDGAVSRDGQGQGLCLEVVEGGTHLRQGDPRRARGGLQWGSW